MIKCPSCGMENPDDSKFCTGCGANLTPTASAGQTSCAGCGASMPADSKFCVACGQPAGAPPTATPAYCTACGAALEPGSSFCTACGVRLAAGTGAPGSAAPAAAGDEGAVLSAYLTALEGRLAQGGFEAVAQGAGLVADRIYKRQRFDLAKAGKVTTLCAVKWFAAAPAAESIRSYSAAVFNFANTQKGLLARSSFQPLVVYPVAVASECPPEVQAFLSSHWPKRLMAYEFPVVVALATRQIFCHRSTPVWGMAFHAGFVREAGLLFQP